MNKFKIKSPYYDVLVLGNGFDLHLGLHSSFSNFFEKEVLIDGAIKPKCKNLLYYLIFLRFYYKQRRSNTFFRTVFNDNPNWMDVEGFLKKIATDPKMLEGIYSSMRFRNGTSLLAGVDEFEKLIGGFLSKLNLPTSNYDYDTIKKLLTDNLQEFENQFFEYLKKEVETIEDFNQKQADFISKIFENVYGGNLDNYSLSVLNFNYTANNLNLYKEANVHGTLKSRVVIGYDSTTAPIKEHDVFGLSKEWRKMDVDFSFGIEGDLINYIVCYGHSLGEQDYPYFFKLFDECKLAEEKSYVKLYFCYSEFGDENNKRIELEKYKMNAAKMLNAYERYKNPSIQRNTIVTNLKIGHRLFFKKIK